MSVENRNLVRWVGGRNQERRLLQAAWLQLPLPL